MKTSHKTAAAELDGSTPVASSTLHGELYDAHLNSMLRRFCNFMLRHPSMILTFGYLLCSVLGMLFSTRLFALFDFNILPYLELTDFMLAALTHPWILLNVIGWLLLLVMLFAVDRFVRRHVHIYAVWSEKYYNPVQFQRYNLIFVLIPLLFLYNAAKEESAKLAERIKNDKQPKFHVSLIYPVQDAVNTLKFDQVQVIARTSSYLFVYYRKQVRVIPHANVAVIMPIAPAPLADPATNVQPIPEASNNKADSATTEKVEALNAEVESGKDNAAINKKGSGAI
ncbi:hypothetical protein [Arsukibacterium sp.]|uniref:hypothetical protein n=1 Tax=Arsukibacterium sp. TaxID=1977258 RepID=UPI0035699A38